LDELIEEFEEIFREEPGLIGGYESKLPLQYSEPIYQRPYAIPMSQQKAVVEEVERILKMGIIERSRSPYSLPVVPVFKKNEKMRICIDARNINTHIIPDREQPIPIEDILIIFKKVKYISTIDLWSGYWQVPLEEASLTACSFLFNGRNYSFTRIPFGLNVSGAEFQKAMDIVLGLPVRDS
jgi:hypothetical protein